MEYYEFDSEKAFKEASEPSRRTFFKKIGAVVAGAVAGDRILGKTPEKPVYIPDPPPPAYEQHYDFNSMLSSGATFSTYSTTPIGYTCILGDYPYHPMKDK